MAYSNKVIDHYENPRNVGSLPKDDPNVGTGLVGAPECGDVMGDRYGPVVVARKDGPSSLKGVRVAIPGELTTAVSLSAT